MIKAKKQSVLSRFLLAIALPLLIAGCARWVVTRVDVQSFEARPQRLSREQILTQLTAVLVERGFDIKVTNKEAGLVTTEYKKVGSEGSNPPFDYYLQIRSTIGGTDAAPVLKLSPLVKEQNRTNAAAFTEHELSYYTGTPSSIRMIDSMKGNGWRSIGQATFMNIIADMAGKMGMSVDDFAKNVTNSTANAITAK